MKTLEIFESYTVSTATAYGRRSWHASLVFNNRMWVMAGPSNSSHSDIWASTDGMHWDLVTERASFIPRRNLAATIFKNKMWITGGRTSCSSGNQSLNDVWFSENGKDWKSATLNANFTKRFGHTLTTFRGSLWIIGGLKKSGIWVIDKIISSNDGEHWLPGVYNPPFGNRSYHTTVVHDNKLWVIGGVGASMLGPEKAGNAEVWYSGNGHDWILATEDAGFPPRFGHTAVTDGNHIYVMGGSNSNKNHHQLNDIWRSYNGVDWEKIKVTDPPAKRLGHTSLLFNNRIWALDGAQFTFKEQTDSASIASMESISNCWFMNLIPYKR